MVKQSFSAFSFGTLAHFPRDSPEQLHPNILGAWDILGSSNLMCKDQRLLWAPGAAKGQGWLTLKLKAWLLEVDYQGVREEPQDPEGHFEQLARHRVALLGSARFLAVPSAHSSEEYFRDYKEIPEFIVQEVHPTCTV